MQFAVAARRIDLLAVRMKQDPAYGLIVAVVSDQELACFGVEDLGRLIATARGKLGAVRIPGDGKPPVAVAGDGELLAAARHVEDMDNAVGRGRGQAVPLGIE